MPKEYCPECGEGMVMTPAKAVWYCGECDCNYTQCEECEQWYPTDNETCDFCNGESGDINIFFNPASEEFFNHMKKILGEE